MMDNKKFKTQFWIIVAGAIVLLMFKVSIFKTTQVETKFQLEKITEDINKRSPTTIDEGLRLDSANISWDTLHYYLTFPFLKSDHIFKGKRKHRIQQNAIRFLKQNANMKYFRESKTPLVYHYYDMHQKQMFSIGIQYDRKDKVKELF
ncbi:hypothetical protein K4L44_01940 [Halosquirtibacter laminarini]|uniref:Uncharacterized protein n=1 Tax=Halosquirtibacter laminarini TaxID=3374600 RepID=A0AC61NND5_9BACT|nr:hypothetical protein K4L44_01940 [Prolixibacteraceae bacterium]